MSWKSRLRPLIEIRRKSRFSRGVAPVRRAASIDQEFQRLASEWKEDTAVHSSMTRIAMHPAYQRIIGMGPAVLPLILRDLQASPSLWFWALHAITGQDPVAPEARGDIDLMTSAWIEWGRSQGLM